MGLLKKITGGAKKLVKGAGKVVKKVVPKEVAGIMQAAAPFVAASNPMAALALTTAGQYRQRGRISPLQTALSLAPSPQVRGFTRGETGLFGLDSLKLTGRAADIGGGLDTFLYGLGGEKETRGFLGTGGEFGFKEFTKGKLLSPTLNEAGKPILSKTRVAALAASGLSLAQTQKQIEEEAVEVGASDSELARLQQEAAEMWKDFDTTAFRPKITAAIGGFMRKNLREGSEGNELPPDPTKPIGVPPGFKPKPIGPVLPNKAEASPMSILNDMAIQLFGKPLDELDDRQKEMIMSFMKPKAQQGGLMRANYALGTKPTKEESGLGGLPIEADMRYTGGFMPYGAKEKADDVPARLSKNEFVFTADAVRAAGGGSVQKGAQRMYNTMKQLESMGKMA